jgi:hypothetical protein
MMTAWPHQSECDSYYGNPRVDNAHWQAENLTMVRCPWRMVMGQTIVQSIRIHRKCAASLGEVLADAWDAIGHSQFEAHRRGWDTYSGSYNFRPIRGSTHLSMHAYGCAIDFDGPHNQLHSSPTDGVGFTESDPLVQAFEGQGWIWGGRWTGRSDPMHFQAAIV